MKFADGRPRVHIRPCPPGWRASSGPNGLPTARFSTPGEALDAQLFKLDNRWRGGTVVIIENPHERHPNDPDHD
ncbi:MAG: hypothetical protein K2X76_11855 [Sphingomonas sp.]|nr:hypothetical protein [Sphingomonas sp.]